MSVNAGVQAPRNGWPAFWCPLDLGKAPECLLRVLLEFSICKVGPQTGLLGETTACPEVDPLLHEWLSPTSLQQGQIGRTFKWHLVSNGVVFIMTVAVITGAMAGVYQLFLSSCHFRQRSKASKQNSRCQTFTLQGADAMTGREWA